MRLFWAKGFAATSMNDLIAAMGIASPSIYAAFGSKASLYEAALEHYVSLHEDLVLGAMQRPTARETIEALLRNAVTVFSHTDFPSGCMVEQTAADSADMSAELVARVGDMRTANNENFSTRLRKGVEDGDVSEGVDIDAVASFYATVHKGLSLSARGGTGTSELNSVIDSAMAAWPVLTRPCPGRKTCVRW
jgi:AcrR family transcriptional regulator